MNYIAMAIVCLLSLNLSSQESEKTAVQNTIEAFFEGFHDQDSVRIKQTVSHEVILQTIFKDSLRMHLVRVEDFSGFLKSIVAIPKTTKFQEVIKSYSIQVDGPMANAWTPYEFRVNDTFSHCGVNSFQLLKSHGKWKIIYLVETRRKEDCD